MWKILMILKKSGEYDVDVICCTKKIITLYTDDYNFMDISSWPNSAHL